MKKFQKLIFASSPQLQGGAPAASCLTVVGGILKSTIREPMGQADKTGVSCDCSNMVSMNEPAAELEETTETGVSCGYTPSELAQIKAMPHGTTYNTSRYGIQLANKAMSTLSSWIEVS